MNNGYFAVFFKSLSLHPPAVKVCSLYTELKKEKTFSHVLHLLRLTRVTSFSCICRPLQRWLAQLNTNKCLVFTLRCYGFHMQLGLSQRTENLHFYITFKALGLLHLSYFISYVLWLDKFLQTEINQSSADHFVVTVSQ